MIKPLINIGLVLVSIYLAGNVARQNPKFNAFIIFIENGYDGLNKKIQGTHLRQGISLLQRIYGFLTFFIVVLFLIVPHVTSGSNEYTAILAIVFIIFITGWGSLSWCMQHQKALNEHLSMAMLMVISPFAMAFLEKQFDIKLLSVMLQPIFKFLPYVNIYFIPESNVWILAVLLSICLLIALVVQYVAMWLIAMPVLFLSIALVSSAILFARFVNVIAPQKAFSGLMLIVFVVLSILQINV